jgi:hypothetical protein
MGKRSLKTILSALITLGLFFASAHAADNLPSFEQYVSDLGTTYCQKPEITFQEIGDSATKNGDRLWPFDPEDAKEKYAKTVDSIMGTLFRPVSADNGNPLRVSMSVSILNEKDALSAQIQVKVYKETKYFFTAEGKEPVPLSSVPRVFWDRTYLYIDADYLADENSPGYSFRETIDKYFKEFLFEFVQDTLYSYKLMNQISEFEEDAKEEDMPSAFEDLKGSPSSI